MSVRSAFVVAGVECSKLASQMKVRIALGVCLAAPFGFAIAMVVQSALPEDTLFGRSVRDSGFALPLVVLGFAVLWVVPALASVVAGDTFAAEDRYGTWSTILTRSCSRGEVFAGKTLAAFGFSLLAVVMLTASSLAAGLLVINAHPLIDLSGVELPPVAAFIRVVAAWLSIVPPVCAFTAIAVLLSVSTRSSAAGIGLPVLIGLAMQGLLFLDGPDVLRRFVIASAFGAWHGLMTEPRYYRPLLYSVVISDGYVLICLSTAYSMMRRRDIAGQG